MSPKSKPILLKNLLGELFPNNWACQTTATYAEYPIIIGPHPPLCTVDTFFNGFDIAPSTMNMVVCGFTVPQTASSTCSVMTPDSTQQYGFISVLYEKGNYAWHKVPADATLQQVFGCKYNTAESRIYAIVSTLFVFRIVKLTAVAGTSLLEVLVDWAGDSGQLIVHNLRVDPANEHLFILCQSRKITTFHPTGNIEVAGILKTDDNLVFQWF